MRQGHAQACEGPARGCPPRGRGTQPPRQLGVCARRLTAQAARPSSDPPEAVGNSASSRTPPSRRCSREGSVRRLSKRPRARKFVIPQRRGVRRVAPLFECGARRSQLLPTAPGAVNENDVFGVGHETKDDSQRTKLCPIAAHRRSTAKKRVATSSQTHIYQRITNRRGRTGIYCHINHLRHAP